MCSWTHLDPSFIPNAPPTAWNWPSLRFLLRAWCISDMFWSLPWIQWTLIGEIYQYSLLWIHKGHVMCSWTHLDPASIPNTPTTAWTWSSLRFLLRAWYISDMFWSLPWIQWTLIGETHQYQSFIDP
jgi:hypothetical protein